MISMAKHSRMWNESIYRKYISEGRGQGSGNNYTPWIKVQDFSSNGMVSRVCGNKTGRIHHLMSNNELNFFYLLDWSDDVLDIREQFPLLDLPQIIEIAEKSGVQYPYDNKSGFPYVMTSDFFIQTVNDFKVITVKPSADLKKRRVREKLEIERRYWSKKNIEWKIVTESEINAVKAKNIEWLSQARNFKQFGVSEELWDFCAEYFMEQFSVNQSTLETLFHKIERRFDLKYGMGLNIYKYLVYHKKIQVNICEPLIFSDSERLGIIYG